MEPDLRSYLVAGATALLAVVGYAAHHALYEEVSAASAQYDPNIGTAFGAFLALSFLAMSFVVFTEAALLAGLVALTDLPPWGRRLLETGSAAGGLAMVPAAAWAFGEAPGTTLLGAWWLLAGFSVLGFSLGILATVLGPLTRSHGWLLVGTLATILGLTVFTPSLRGGSSMEPNVTGSPPVFFALGLYALALAGLLAATTERRPDAAHWLALPLALVCVFVAVLGFMDDSFWLGTPPALAAILTFWAFWTLYPRDRSTTEPPGRRRRPTPD
jgi:phosphatidylglycerophosphate synthase